MPCHVDPTPQERRESAIKTAASHFEPLLCSACRVLERLGYDFDENPALSVWWAKHQEEDAQKAIAQLKKKPHRRFIGVFDVEPNDIAVDGDFFVLSTTKQTLCLENGNWVELITIDDTWMKMILHPLNPDSPL